MLNRGSQWQRSFSWGVPAFVPLKCQRPDRGPPTQSLCNKETRFQSSLKGGLGQVQLQLPTGIPLW